MSNNTIKYEYTEGCPNDIIGILSLQSYKDKKDKLNSAKHAKIEIEHGISDITLKVVRYDKIIDENGKIIERKDSKKARESEGLTH